MNGVNVRLLRMSPVNMAAWLRCSTLRNATYKKTVLFQIGLSVNPVCRCGQHKRNLNTILLHKPPQCFYVQNWLNNNVQIFQNLGSISKFKAPEGWHWSNVLEVWGPQILRPTIQNSDHHDDPAPGIYSALFFPLVNTRSSADLGRNVGNVQCASVFIYRDGNGAQQLSSQRTLQRARVKAK
jgi:hypothetical protein